MEAPCIIIILYLALFKYFLIYLRRFVIFFNFSFFSFSINRYEKIVNIFSCYIFKKSYFS